MPAALGTVLALVLGAVVWVLVAGDDAFHEERVTISGPRGELHAVLAAPVADDGPHGLVVTVHGDGPAPASSDLARPVWNAYAKAGFATLSWDKPGVNNAPGDWLGQTMRDRVAEVEAAISWAYTRPDLDTTRIGLSGQGQAGWVIPDVLAARSDIRFAVLVGPAINWLRQDDYRLRRGLSTRGASAAETTVAVDGRHQRLQLLQSGADYSAYLRSGVDPSPMSAARWGFVERNFRADATDALARISVPLLLVLGGDDRQVDVAETESVYRRQMRPDLLVVKRIDGATHLLTRNGIEYRDDFRVEVRELFAPSTVYAPGYLDALRIFADRHSR